LCKNLHLDPRHIQAQHGCVVSDGKEVYIMNKIKGAAIIATVLSLLPFAFSQSYSITDLGTLPGGTYSTGLAVNDHGTVAGYSSLSNGVEHAVIWAGGRIHDIETLGDSASNSGARAINNSGQAAGYSFLSDHATIHAFSWTNSTGMQDLGTLGGITSTATGINKAGQIVGGSYLSDGISVHAFLGPQPQACKILEPWAEMSATRLELTMREMLLAIPTSRAT
jgi:probable HAF family extracellular repeat protein